MGFSKVREFITNKDYRKFFLAKRGFYGELSDKDYISIVYKYEFGKDLNWDNPTTLSEKLQYLKIYDRKPIYTMMVDKILMKEYVSDRIGSGHVVPLLGVWDSPDLIDFDSLPEQFVLKCNHASGLGMITCKNKAAFNVCEAKKLLWEGFNFNYYEKVVKEWPYKNVQHRILAEKLLNDGTGGLRDYKFFCFNGEPRFLYVADGSCSSSEKESFLNFDWEYMPFERLGFDAHIKKPDYPGADVLNEMISFSRELSRDTRFLRVDFYWHKGVVLVGELTFFPGSGFIKFSPESWNTYLGSWISLDGIG